jgi:hypothetical protein
MPVLEVSGTTTGITVNAVDDDARADENVMPHAWQKSRYGKILEKKTHDRQRSKHDEIQRKTQ